MIEIIVLAGLFVASYFDFKEHSIPPLLNYSMIVLGVLLNFILVLLSQPYQFFMNCAVALICISFAFALYKLGIWAGGDFKLFAALSFLIPINQGLIFFPFLILLSALLAFFPFALIYVSFLIAKSKEIKKLALQKFWSKRFEIFRTANFALLSLFIINYFEIHFAFGFLIFLLLSLTRKYSKYLAAGIPMIFIYFNQYILQYLIYITVIAVLDLGFASFNILRKKVFIEKVDVVDLKEGMMSLEDFWLEDKEIKHNVPKFFSPENTKLKINSRMARGLTRKEIQFLKRNPIQFIYVKKSIPFVPVLLLGYICLLIYTRFL